eukprot:831709-Prymnesium_polylepis.1
MEMRQSTSAHGVARQPRRQLTAARAATVPAEAVTHALSRQQCIHNLLQRGGRRRPRRPLQLAHTHAAAQQNIHHY